MCCKLIPIIPAAKKASPISKDIFYWNHVDKHEALVTEEEFC